MTNSLVAGTQRVHSSLIAAVRGRAQSVDLGGGGGARQVPRAGERRRHKSKNAAGKITVGFSRNSPRNLNRCTHIQARVRTTTVYHYYTVYHRAPALSDKTCDSPRIGGVDRIGSRLGTARAVTCTVEKKSFEDKKKNTPNLPNRYNNNSLSAAL